MMLSGDCDWSDYLTLKQPGFFGCPWARGGGVESRLNGFRPITWPFSPPNQPDMVSNES